MEIWTEDLINCKYHLAVSERMIKSYYDFEEKRFLVGAIRQMARAVSCLIKCYLMYEGIKGKDSRKNFNIFMKKVGPKYLDQVTLENLFKVLEIEKSQKISPVEFARGDKIILLINGKYKFLTVERLKEFLNSIKDAVSFFPRDFRQV